MNTGGWTPRRLAAVVGVVLAAALLPAAALAGAGWTAAALLVAALAAGGLALAPAPRIRRSAAERQRARELRSRAEQQDRWTARGDMRGVYGVEGAELMRTVSPPDDGIAPDDEVPTAGVVHTDAELQAMLRDKPPCWRYAAFTSILVQRRAAVQTRLHDARMGFGVASGEFTRTDLETAMFFMERFDDLASFTDDITGFMLSPGFQGVMGAGEQSEDPAEIVHAAHRLMDFHERALRLAERCRAVTVPATVRDLQRDFAALAVSLLESFQTFIGDMVTRVAEMAEVARYATGSVELDPVVMDFGDREDRLARISARLLQIRRSA